MVRAARIVSLLGIVFGAALAPYGVYCLRRDRPSLQWPMVLGTIMQADMQRHYSGRTHSVRLIVTYTYKVNGTRYVSHQICLGGADAGRIGTASAFADLHPVGSTVEVRYDPLNPAEAVLIPGADEFTDHVFIYSGVAIFLLSGFQFFRTHREYVRLAARRPRDQNAAPVSGKSELCDAPFLTYEPGSKRKLNCFRDRESLLDALSQGRKLQEWQPDDRAIDVSGRLYRFVGHDNNRRYEMEATGETWDWTRLLAVATSDAAVIKRDPRAIESRAEQAPDADKIAVIMQCVDELPAAPLWLWIALGLFFLLFFLAVMFGAGYLFLWLGKQRF